MDSSEQLWDGPTRNAPPPDLMMPAGGPATAEWPAGIAWHHLPLEEDPPGTGSPNAFVDDLDELLWGTRRIGDVELAAPPPDDGLVPEDPEPLEASRPDADLGVAESTGSWNIPSEYLTQLFAVAESQAPRILYLEDDTQHATAARRVLVGAGYRVNCCPDPNWLQPTLQSFDPDLVIVDVPRHDMATVDLLRCLWAARRSASVPIVLMCRELLDPLDLKDRWLGLDVMERPADVAHLVPALARRLDRASALEELFKASLKP